MSSIFPIRRRVQLDEGRGHRLVDLDEDVADEVFEALSSETTRQIFGALHDSPQTASDLAAATDTSVQNVQYHLGKLTDADLIEVADTWYSERGTEMKVYAPTDESLVLVAGRDDGGRLRSLLERAVAGLGLLAAASAGVAWLARRALDGGVAAGHRADGESVGIATDGGPESTAAAADAALSLDPGLLAGLAFFVGGAFVLAVVGAVWYWRGKG